MLKIGFVENDPLYADILQKELEKVPDLETIKHWTSGELCYNDPTKRDIDIFFVDIGLPGMSGADLIELLASEQPESRIVLLTSLQSDELIFRCLKRGAIG